MKFTDFGEDIGEGDLVHRLRCDKSISTLCTKLDGLFTLEEIIIALLLIDVEIRGSFVELVVDHEKLFGDEGEGFDLLITRDAFEKLIKKARTVIKDGITIIKSVTFVEFDDCDFHRREGKIDILTGEEV